MIHLLPTIRQDIRECHARKSQIMPEKMMGDEGMCSSCFLKRKYTCLTCGNYFCMRCSVFENEEDTPGWKEGKSVAYCEWRFNELMERRESSHSQDVNAVGKETERYLLSQYLHSRWFAV